MDEQIEKRPWRKRFVQAAGFGCGFALFAGLLIGFAIWWSSRPPKPKPWNPNAITASYDGISTEGEHNTVEFFYTLQNNTDTDFQIQDGTNIHLAAHLRRSNSLSFSNDDMIKVDYPIYVPARSRAHFIVHLGYPTPLKEDVDAPKDVRHDFETSLAKYVVTELNNIDGLALLDDRSRYRIDMPDGWDQRAKEDLRAKAPAAGK